MKRLVLYVALGLTLGAASGDMLSAVAADGGPAARIAKRHHAATAFEMTAPGADMPLRAAGNGTVEFAMQDGAASGGVPQEILDARAQGATARQESIQQTIGQVFPKGGDWGMGGPLFPLSHPFAGQPVPRPTRTTVFASIPDPAGAPAPPGWSIFGPGQFGPAMYVPHYYIAGESSSQPPGSQPPGSQPPSPPPVQPPPVQPPPVQPPPVQPPPSPPPVVPEPSSWLLMLLGFAALAVRLRVRRKAPRAS